MARFILVHGAWHGGWCWQRVLPLLREAGHEAHAPSLSGLGDCRHLLAPGVGLHTHVEDILGLIESLPAGQVTLCGHSYAGAVITAVADRLPVRVGALVYIDAPVLRNGESILDTMLPDRRAAVLRAARERGQGWRIPLSPAERGETDREALDRLWHRFRVDRKEDRDWLEQRCTDHPLRSFQDRVELSGRYLQVGRKHYLLATEHVPSAYHAVADRLRDQPGWEVSEVAAGHEAMVTHPTELARALLATARLCG